MSVDLTKLAVGDKVLVRATVVDVDREDAQLPVKLDVGGRAALVWSSGTSIVSVESRPIRAGLQLLSPDGDKYEVVADPREYGGGVEVPLWNASYGFSLWTPDRLADWERVAA